LIATINDRAVIKKILGTSAGGLRSAGHLGLPTDAPAPMPAQVAGWLPGVDTPADWIPE